jgi:hypothetical protein
MRLDFDRCRQICKKYDPFEKTEHGSSEKTTYDVLCGPFLCDLRVLTETEWAALPATERPHDCVYAPGLGWVCAVPSAIMN